MMRKIFLIIIAAAIFIPSVGLFSAISAKAADATSASESTASQLTLSLTPPLFQVSLIPGQTWNSVLRVTNANSFNLTVYANTLNFQPNGESGQGEFTPLLNGDPSGTLASWVQITSAPITIAPGKSSDVPFSISVPKNASPGGHYAAILMGTSPTTTNNDQSQVRVSSNVSSLLFVRIAGDIMEKGDIRTFVTDKSFYSKPDVNFTLRFQNFGNVDLQPQGQITIYNMWGKERGTIEINQNSDFGNVLPASIRKFDFEWQGDDNFFEAGRYKANATLTFGTDARQNVSSTIYFWVIPVESTLVIFGIFFVFIFLGILLIRMYVRRLLRIEQERYGFVPAMQPQTMPLATGRSATARSAKAKKTELSEANPAANPSAPKTRGRSKKTAAEEIAADQNQEVLLPGLKNQRMILIIAIALFVLALVALVFFFSAVLKSERSYQTTVIKDDGRTYQVVNGEIVSNQAAGTPDTGTSATPAASQNSSTSSTQPPPSASSSSATNSITISVLNGTTTTGLATQFKDFLNKKGGYAVDNVGNASQRGYTQTLIEYSAGNQQAAQNLNSLLGNSAKIQENDSITDNLTVIVGTDFAA